VLAHITGLGLTTTRGLPVSPQTFAQMLRRSLYSGFIETDSWGGVRAASQSEPIVDRATFLRVRALLNNEASTTTAYQRNHPEFPLRVFVRCGCGTPLTGSKAKKVYRYYHCRKGCSGSNVRAEKLEAEFSALLTDLSSPPEFAAAFRVVLRDVWSAKKADARAMATTLKHKIAATAETQQRLLKKFIETDVIPAELFSAENARLNAEKTKAEGELANLDSEELDIEAVARFAEALAVDPSRAWNTANLDQKQRLQKLYFPSGLQFSAGKFGTPATGWFFSQLAANREEKSRLVAHTGFEPVLPP
jgi:hypothetical protein